MARTSSETRFRFIRHTEHYSVFRAPVIVTGRSDAGIVREFDIYIPRDRMNHTKIGDFTGFINSVDFGSEKLELSLRIDRAEEDLREMRRRLDAL